MLNHRQFDRDIVRVVRENVMMPPSHAVGQFGALSPIALLAPYVLNAYICNLTTCVAGSVAVARLLTRLYAPLRFA